MTYKRTLPEDAPQRTPYQFVLFLLLAALVGWTALRALLIYSFVPPPHFTPELGDVLWRGFQRDAFVALILLVPVLAWFLVVPQRWYIERWQRFFFWLVAALVFLSHVTLLATEYFFFAEFHKRFDGAAVSLGLQPEQALTLLPKTAAWWLAGCVVVASLFLVIAKRRYTSMWLATSSAWKRIGWFLLTLGLVGGLYYTLNLNVPIYAHDSALNEIANNGLLSLAQAVRNHEQNDAAVQLALARVELQPDPPFAVTGTIRKHEAFTSKLVESRHVYVWLPPSYEQAPDKRYPVIYANDGQNQFDPRLSFIGVDWALDETMTRLIADKKVREAIIVAVGNTPRRLQEYVPQKAVLSALDTPREAAMRKLAKESNLNLDEASWRLSNDYLKFLVSELKPFIDAEYRTYANRDNTFIMGSSAGAMISLYAVSEYPDVFGGAACISTHWPLADGLLVEYFKDQLPDPATHRLYFDFGTETLDKNYEPYQLKLDAARELRGYQRGTNWMTCKFKGAEHSEKAWRKRAHVPLEFLLGKPATDK